MFYGRVWSKMCLGFCNTLWTRRGDCADGAVGAVDQCRKYLMKFGALRGNL